MEKVLKEVRLILIPCQVEKLEIGMFIQYRGKDKSFPTETPYLYRIKNQKDLDIISSFQAVKPYLVSDNDIVKKGDYFIWKDPEVKSGMVTIGGGEVSFFNFKHEDIRKVITVPDQIGLTYPETDHGDQIDEVNGDDLQYIMENGGKCWVEMEFQPVNHASGLKPTGHPIMDIAIWENYTLKLIDNKAIIYLHENN